MFGKIFKAVTGVLGKIPGLGKVFQELEKVFNQITQLLNEIKQLASKLAEIAMTPLKDVLDQIGVLKPIAQLARKVMELANIPILREAIQLLSYTPLGMTPVGLAIQKGLKIAQMASVLDSDNMAMRLQAVQGIGNLLNIETPVIGDILKPMEAIAGVDGLNQKIIDKVAELTTIRINKLSKDEKLSAGFMLNFATGQWRVTAALSPDAPKKTSVLDAYDSRRNADGIFDAKSLLQPNGGAAFSPFSSNKDAVFNSSTAIFQSPVKDWTPSQPSKP